MRRFVLAAIAFVVMAAPGTAQDRPAVLVTGSSSGIGLKITEVLSANGYLVYAGARSADDLARLDAMENVESIRLDVTDQAEIDAAVEVVSAAGRGVIDRVTATAPGKPAFLFEFGVTMGNPLGDAATWADVALSDLFTDRWPAVRGFSWWNETWENDGNATHDTNMRVQDVPGLSAVFQARLSSPDLVDRPIG
jgi:NAD(P)-dependent dehydrogenase (short-subunit alcohol dehydrogenase family)